MENMENGILGIFEPKCKIRFLSDPKPEEEYIAVPASEMIDLIADQMKLMALDGGGVDNWPAHGWAMEDYMEELRHNCYDREKLSQWVMMEKPNDMTIDEYIDEMSIEDFARFEVWSM